MLTYPSALDDTDDPGSNLIVLFLAALGSALQRKAKR